MSITFSHADNPEMQAQVILASKTTTGAPPLVTMRLRYPRIIHAELMTHRVFSRNARSSRAVPVKRMLEEIREKPFIPWHWGKNQKGMQADEDHNATVRILRFDRSMFMLDYYESFEDEVENHEAWLEARDHALDIASAFELAGYHKQVVNRLVEPFMWIDVLVTSTDWKNFLWLRDHKDAEPHIRDLACLVEQALGTAETQILDQDQWHLPYITEEDIWHAADLFKGPVNPKLARGQADWLCRISAARCARISYAPFDGNASFEREIERYDMLVSSDRIHASPLEHQATPDTRSETYHCSAFQDGTVDPGDAELVEQWDNPHLHGNLRGWQQFRKMVANEAAPEV